MSNDTESEEGGDGSLHIFETLTSKEGHNRLSLIYKERRMDGWDGPGFDFHSILWETRTGSQWAELRRITQEEFQEGIAVERWVSKLDSFNPKRGSVIIQIGKTDRPQSEGTCFVTYSWRQWDLGANQQIRHFYDCTEDEIFDPYNPDKHSEAGTGQPATPPVLNSEVSEKSQPNAEGRSR